MNKKLFWKLIECIRKISFLDIVYIYIEAFYHHRKIIKLIPDTFRDYCKTHKIAINEVEPRKQRIVLEPSYFEISKEKEHYFESPNICVMQLDFAKVFGGTGFVAMQSRLLLDAYNADLARRVLYKFGIIKRVDRRFFWIEVLPQKPVVLKEAINLCGFASCNYYHFTIEILSRLRYIDNIEDTNSVPLLIDEEIKRYPQLIEILEIVSSKRNIIFVSQGTAVVVEHLIQPSMNTWMPLNIKKKDWFLTSDNLIAKSSVENIRKSVSKYIQIQKERKIYISRKKVSLCRIENEMDVIQIFERGGFEIVYPENLSYLEQITLFSTAKCVAGATGAAFTNLIYCNPGTIFGCIIPKKYNFCVYSTIACLVGAKSIFLDVDISKETDYMSTDQYCVNLETCERYVNELNRLCEL